MPSAKAPAGADSERRAAARQAILDLLDGAKERHEKAFPGAEAESFDYFAHLSAIRQLTESLYARWLKPHQVSDSEFRVLGSLRTRGRGFRTTPLELNRVARITSAGMTHTLDRLEAAGYVERVPNPDDRRSVHVGLTREGWEFATALIREIDGHTAEILAGASARQRAVETKALRAAVERLADAVTR